jgi:phosphocarrier protein HPr
MIGVRIKSKMGIHARPASQIIALAASYPCELYIVKDGKSFNAKSIMNILSMGLKYDDEIMVYSNDEHSTDAVEALVKLLKTFE